MTPNRPHLVIHAAVALSLVALGAMCGPEAIAQANTRADQVRNYNAQVLQAQSELRRAQSTAQANAARAKAAQVLEARAAALSEVIATNPTQAEALAFPAGVLKDLSASFPEAKAKLEQRGKWAGELEYLIEDDANMVSHRDIFKLRGKSETLDLTFSGKAPATLRSGQKLDVTGVRIGKAVAASEVTLTDAGMDATTTNSTTSTYPATCAATGPQSVVSILVNLPGYTLPTSTTQDFIRGALLGNAYAGASQSTPDWSVDDFWRQNSDGKTFVDPANTTVVGPISVSSNFNTDSAGASYCDYYGLRDAVMKAVDGQVDFKRYNRIQIVFPANGACSWSGMANVGCRTLSTTGDGSFNSSVSWQKAGSMTTRARAVQLSTHEFGHTFGLRHASSRDYGAEPLGSVTAAGTLNEYGDVHSTMGSWNFGFYASSHAANTLKWLGTGNYQTVESPGTYTIQNYEGRPAGVKALKIRRGTGNDAWLWVESRQNTGIYSSQLNSSLFSGALIHYQDSSTGDYSHLVDFTGGTTSFGDAPLAAGQTWNDPYSNVSVTVNSVASNAMTVTVNYGSLPCTTAAPTITAAPTSVATSYGSSTNFTVTVKNNSSSGCAAEAFDLAGVVPSGWSQAFGTGRLTINPGQQAQTTLKVSVPNPYALGTYTVTASATSAASTKKASDTESVTVTEPMYRLSLGFGGSGSGSVAFSTPVKTCTSACTADYTASANATVTLKATPASRNTFSGWSGACTGTATSCTVTMNAAKSVTANFAKTTGKK